MISRYSLPMGKNVKTDVAERQRRNRTKVSSKHQVTIPSAAFRSAGLQPGDLLKVEAEGAGRIVLTRLDELLDRYSGCLDTGGGLRQGVEGLRGEWR
jgi:AbrB family looped-hinge helix DNA binding protein